MTPAMNQAFALGFICAVAIAFLFVQLDKIKVTSAELEPIVETPPVPGRRKGLIFTLDRLGRRLTAGHAEERKAAIQARLDLAGNPLNLTPSGFEAARLGVAAVAVVPALVIGLLSARPAIGLGIAVAAALLGYWMPPFLINSMAGSRRKEIERNLPDAVDLLTLAVEAGLSLDAGMADITLRFNNPLALEFGKVIRETRLGRPRLVAMEAMARRTGVGELHNLVQAITQSEQMGIGIAKTLRVQASELRRRRRQIAQESAARASLQMIVPMIGCIFPTIWIILLGPAILVILKGSVHR